MSAFCNKRTSRLLRTSVTLAVMFIWRVCVRHEIGVWIAPAPIACQNTRPALFNRAILAVPVHAAIAVIHHGAPRRGVGLSRLQTNRAYSSNSNDDATCASSISLPISELGKLPFRAIPSEELARTLRAPKSSGWFAQWSETRANFL